MSFSSVSSKPQEDEDDPPHATQDQFDDATDKSDEANEEPLDPRIQVRPSYDHFICNTRMSRLNWNVPMLQRVKSTISKLSSM